MTDEDTDLRDLTFDREEDGTIVRRQIDRVILAEGAWATVLFLYQDRDRGSGAFLPPRAAIVRFRKLNGAYRRQSSLPLATADDARRLITVLESWHPRMAAADSESGQGETPPLGN